MTPETMPVLLTTAEVAALFRLTPKQANRWAVKYPQLGAWRAGPRAPWRWPESKVRAALADGLHKKEQR